ncbi:MAG: response regulator [Leptolyngbyaceae cyanobacterium bins.349]|nr:response regulator [Leptolyngbyaceae cyanobacterium bins.349]
MKRILVIDDDPLVRESLHDVLESYGFAALTANNGRTGLQLAAEKQPDLILCDVQMPELDGYAVLQALRAHPTLNTTPFVFLTARSDYSDLRQGMNLGADDYLPKPCGVDELLVVLNNRLQKHDVLQAQSRQQLDSLRSNIALSLPHEFRTPLAGILTSVELLRLVVDGSENATEVIEIADTIQTAAQRLHRLIQNFLLYSKLEVAVRDPAYKLSLTDEMVCEPLYTITTVTATLAAQYQRSADLQVALQNTPIAFSHFDLEKVMTEVLDNAFKFSMPQTPVTVTSEIQADHYHIQVINHGRGMTADQIAHLGGYMQFNRHLYEQQGVGLGLAIAQRLLELREGRLTIESIPNHTTTVSIVLPCAIEPIAALDLDTQP